MEVLKRLQPGLSNAEYAGSYLLMGDRVAAFNREVAIQCEFPIGVEGSVEGEKLLALLGKMKADKLTIRPDADQLVVSGGRQSFGIKLGGQDEALIRRLEALPYADMKWRRVPEGFREGLTFCSYCASQDATKPYLLGVLVRGRDLLASDNLRISWFTLPADFPGGPLLIPAHEYLQVSNHPCEEYAVEDGWLHFRGGALYHSLLLMPLAEEFPAEAAKGFFPKKVTAAQQFTIPKTFTTTLENSLVLGKEQSFYDRTVKLFSKGDGLYCRSETENEWYEEHVEFNDQVNRFEIAINPAFLSWVLKYEGKSYLAGEGKMLFEGSNFKHLISF